MDSGRPLQTIAVNSANPNDATPLASVIVPTRNAALTLVEQLTALASQENAPPFEVIVVDNLSGDGCDELAAAFASRDPRFSCLRALGVGVNYARIVGAQAARSAELLFCDADDVVDPGWVREMVKGLKSYDLVSGALDEERLNPRAPAGCRADPMSDLNRVDISDWRFASGACLGIRRRVLESVGGWRADHPLKTAGDDVDLSWRCQAAGYSVGFVPTAVVHYRHRPDTRSAMLQFYRYGKSLPYLYTVHRQLSAVAWRPRSAAATWRWRWLLANAGRAIVDQRVRWYWLREAAFVAGRVSGCVRYRVLCL